MAAQLKTPMRVVIIGGGFSGAITAVHLLRADRPDLNVSIIEPGERLGPGLAFGACEPQHLLNVPAGKMSALPDEPAHFLRWLEAQRSGPRAELIPPDLSPASFVSRRLFGDYVEELLASSRGSSRCGFRRITARAIGAAASPDGTSIELSEGEKVVGDIVVLALGNIAPTAIHPACRPIADHPRYVHNIWTRAPWRECAPNDTVLIIGTGLTMVDAVLSFARSGHRGRIIGVSRRGLLPAVHNLGVTHPAFIDPTTPINLRSLLQRIRSEVRRARTGDTPWQAVLDSLRSATPAVWAQLTPRDRRRFMRHVKSYWETNRHRLAPELHAEIEALMRCERLTIRAAALVSAAPSGGAIEAALRPRGSGAIERMTVDWVVNCTGPEGRLDRLTAPLFRSLFDGGFVSGDPLSLGLAASPEGFAIDARGEPSLSMIILGGLLKGMYWETTAVPELRAQGAAAAQTILDQLP